jgi:hypothetical protein
MPPTHQTQQCRPPRPRGQRGRGRQARSVNARCPSLAVAPRSSVRMDAASIAAVSLFGRQPKFGILWSAERGSTARRAPGGSARSCSWSGRAGCGAHLGGGGTLLIGSTWPRCGRGAGPDHSSRGSPATANSAGVIGHWCMGGLGLPVAIRDPRPGRYGGTRKLMSSTQPQHLCWICRVFGFPCGCAKFGV